MLFYFAFFTKNEISTDKVGKCIIVRWSTPRSSSRWCEDREGRRARRVAGQRWRVIKAQAEERARAGCEREAAIEAARRRDARPLQIRASLPAPPVQDAPPAAALAKDTATASDA